MDAQARYMYQRNPNEPGQNGSRGPNNGGSGNNGNGPKRPSTRTLIMRSLLLVLAVLLGWYLFQFFTQGSSNQPNTGEVPYSTFYQQVQQNNVKDVVFQNQDATGDFKQAITVPGSNNDQPFTHFHFTQLPNGDPTLVNLLQQHHVQYEAKTSGDNNFLFSLLINVVP